MAKVYQDVRLTELEKAEIFDKLIIHAETIEQGKWLEGAFLPEKVVEEVKSHAISFLYVVRSEIKKIIEARTQAKS